jgi:putative alpha-1,2-mannosidase
MVNASSNSLFFIFIILFFIIDKVASINNPVDFVNLLAGSFTDGNRFSTGNTLPLIGRPWGFNHWSPQSKDGSRRTGSWWFQGSEHRFTWLRCTHQPSPWIGDWGSFLFGPQVGDKIDRNPQFFWEPRAAILKPHLFDATG